jgi:hypothetical protein
MGGGTGHVHPRGALPSSVLLLSSSAALHVRQPRQSSSFTRSARRSLATRCKTESNIRLHYQTTTTTHELRFPVTFTKKLLKRLQLFITSTPFIINAHTDTPSEPYPPPTCLGFSFLLSAGFLRFPRSIQSCHFQPPFDWYTIHPANIDTIRSLDA